MNAGVYFWPAAPPPASSRHAPLSSRQGSPNRLAQPGAASPSQKSPTPGDIIGQPEAPDAYSPPEVASQPSPNLLRMLLALTGHSTKAKPLELTSLLRPPYQTARFQHAGPGNPHSLGLAADISGYYGYRIQQKHPEECVQMTLALLRDLPPGRYRFGMPKAPEIPATVGAPQMPQALLNALQAVTPADAPSPVSDPFLPSTFGVLSTPPDAFGAALGLYVGTTGKPWPFFPPPELETENGVVAPLRDNKGKVVLDAHGQPLPHVLRFRNESYAPEEELADPRLREALIAARKRGVDIIALFPDGPDHVHVDVRQER